jgi:hypothetical protein
MRFKRTAVAVVGAFCAIGLLPAHAAAYPGADGYWAKSCTVDGIRLDATNYFSGTGQEVHTDVDDNSSYNNVLRVVWSSSVAGTFIHSTTSLSDVYRYRASRTERMTLSLRTTYGTSCQIYSD